MRLNSSQAQGLTILLDKVLPCILFQSNDKDIFLTITKVAPRGKVVPIVACLTSFLKTSAVSLSTPMAPAKCEATLSALQPLTSGMASSAAKVSQSAGSWPVWGWRWAGRTGRKEEGADVGGKVWPLEYACVLPVDAVEK